MSLRRNFVLYQRSTSPQVRLPTSPKALEALWRKLPDDEARTQFLSVAINRSRMDVVLLAASVPFPANDFIGSSQSLVRHWIARSKTTQELDAVEKLSSSAFNSLMGQGDQESIRNFAVQAIKNKNVALWERLLTMKLDPFGLGAFGTTLCHMAASHGWIEGLASVESVFPGRVATLFDKSQRTLLHTASKYGQHATVGWLLGMGCDVQARDKNGRSPLFSCVLGHTEMLNSTSMATTWNLVAPILMMHGASPHDNSGKTSRSGSILSKLTVHNSNAATELELIHRVYVQAQKLEEATVPAASGHRVRRI